MIVTFRIIGASLADTVIAPDSAPRSMAIFIMNHCTPNMIRGSMTSSCGSIQAFFYGAATARFCTCSRSSLPPPARARLPEPHSTCYPQPREWLCMSMLAHEHAGPPLFEHGARAALWSSQVSSDTVVVLGPVWRRISDYRIDARTTEEKRQRGPAFNKHR